MTGLSRWLIGAALAATAAPALAQTSIGSATSIEREVSGALSGRVRAVATGDGVFANETIRTANASAAQLKFRDDTNIAIGPSASVVLDRFVFDAGGAASTAAVRATQGALRWVSGQSPAQAYRVTTPHIVIGVRGTSFDLLVRGDRSTVTLNEGAITVCLVRQPRNCVTLTAPGQTVTATSRRFDGVRPDGPPPTRFAETCLRPVDRDLCLAPAAAASGPPPSGWSGFYAGLHGGGGRQDGASITGGSPLVAQSIGFGNVARTLNVAGSGGLAGAQVGYNFQIGQIVLGAEADIAFTRLGGRSGSAVPIPFFNVDVQTTAEQRLRYLGTARARAGFVVGDLLIFGTGGLAYGGVRQSGSIVPVPLNANAGVNPTYRGSNTETAAGWALGGGFEYAFLPGATFKLDYLHYDLGRRTLRLAETTGTAPGEFATMTARARGDVVRAGVNFRF